jgi:hypothetical protein
MPKYNVPEILDIIGNLTNEEKLELQSKLPDVLKFSEKPNSSQPTQSQSQTVGNVSISGRGIVTDMGQKQVMGGGINSPQSVKTVENNSLEEALDLLHNLRQQISSSSLDVLKKATTEAQIKVLEEELRKQKPDENLVSQTVSTLKQGLEGIVALAGPVTQVAKLVATAWGIPML